MKGLLKRSILAGMLALGCVTFASCEKEVPNTPTNTPSNAFQKYRGYIVLNEKGVYTLHKGVEYTIAGNYVSSSIPGVDLDCRDYDIRTNQFVNYPTKPNEDAYDHICDECFPHGLE